MKVYTILLKIGSILCVVGILLVVINYFTGFINSTMTEGASAICLTSFVIALANIMNASKRNKNKESLL